MVCYYMEVRVYDETKNWILLEEPEKNLPVVRNT